MAGSTLIGNLIGGCADSETALARGDRLWADSNYTAALAEYRLSYSRRNDSDEALVRVAHAYAVTGELTRAREHYTQLIERSPVYSDQAVFDYLVLARQAQKRSDRYGMAVAVEAATALREGLPIADLSSGLARYYASTGDAPKALEHYRRALGAARGDSATDLLLEIGSLQESSGNCAAAIETFTALRSRTSDPDQAEQARWRIGSCSWELAQRAQQAGDTVTALRYVDAVIELGTPQNVLDQVWFARGELLLGQGRAADALFSYQTSLQYNRSGTGQLADRARRRIDELRFGRQIQ